MTTLLHSHRLRLRKGLVIEEAEPPPGSPPERTAIRVVDRPQGLRLRFDGSLRAVIELLDGTRGEAEVIAEAARLGVPADETRPLLVTLMFTGLLLGLDEERRQQLLEARASGPTLAEGLPFHLVTGSRFSCGSCGECCRSYSPGPLSQEEIVRISNADFVKNDPELAGQQIFNLQYHIDRDGLHPPSFTIRTREDGSCFFLMADGRCRVHHELGYDAKPEVCKIFPWHVVTTDRAIVISDRTECSTFSRSSAEGVPLEQRFDEVRALFRSRAREQTGGPLAPPVALPGNVVIAYRHYRPVIERLVTLLDEAHGPALVRLEACRNALARFVALVQAAPLAPGVPGGTVQAFEALTTAELSPPDAAGLVDAARAIGLEPDRAAFEEVMRRILRRMAKVARTLDQVSEPPPGSISAVTATGAAPRRVEAPLVNALAALFREGLGVLLGERPGAAVDPLDPVLDAAVHRALRARWHGHELEVEGSAQAGFARTLLVVVTTFACARARAHDRGAARVEPIDWDRGQVAAVRAFLTRAGRNAFREDERDLEALFRHATDLSGVAAGAP